MARNIGTIDQVIRGMLGLALIAYVGKDGYPHAGFGPCGAGRHLSVRHRYPFALSVLRCVGLHHIRTSGSLGLKPPGRGGGNGVSPSRGRPIRQRLYGILDQGSGVDSFGAVVNWTLIGLIIVTLALTVLESVPRLAALRMARRSKRSNTLPWSPFLSNMRRDCGQRSNIRRGAASAPFALARALRPARPA